MSKFNFAFWLSNYQKIFKKRMSQVDIINDLFDEMVLCSSENNVEYKIIPKQRANGLFRGTEPVPKRIVAITYGPDFEDGMIEYLKEIEHNNLNPQS